MRINQHNELAYEAFRQRGTTLNAARCGPYWQSRFSPAALAPVMRYGMAHCLCTIMAEPVLQTYRHFG